MGILGDLAGDVTTILREQWTERDGTVVPDPADLKLGNDAVNLDATVLYADMDGSTDLVDRYDATFAAEVYKCYLHCASNLIRHNGGVITAFDGDRVMGVFIGDLKNTSAVRCALNINYAVNEIINPKIRAQYPNDTFVLQQAIGVDTSKLLVARIGVRGDNDLVWVGRAANYAAKMSGFAGGETWITTDVYRRLADAEKLANGLAIWEPQTWTAKQMTVYRSNWQRSF